MKERLIQLYSSLSMHREALELTARGSEASGGGWTPTIRYLQQIGGADPSLVLEFSYLILTSAPEDAIVIFTEPSPGTTRIPTGLVLGHLRRTAPQLMIHYLETAIRHFEEIGTEFHNELVKLYLEGVLNHPDYAESMSLPTREVAKKESEKGSVGRKRKKLILFLDHMPRYYEPATVLQLFPPNELHQEKAILLRSLGQHKEALAIYAHHLCDDGLAERYCRSLYKQNPVLNANIYVTLLEVYLHPPDSKSIDSCIQAALNLLSKYMERIDTAKALEVLPSEGIAVNALRCFLEASIRHHHDEQRNSSVLSNLITQERRNAEIELVKLKSQRVVMKEGRLCPVCEKKITSDSVFGVYPDGTVVHYSCMEDEFVNPLTGTPV